MTASFQLIAAVILIIAAFLKGCGPLTAFNALAPSDRGSVLAGADIAYGDHPRQKLDVYTPASPSQKSSVPVVVVFYGGSWNSGAKGDYGFLGQALASRGFIVVVADYRLVPEVRFPVFLEDCAKAVVWARANAKKFGGDATNLFLFGHSAGAYNAVMIALDRRYLAAHNLSPSLIRGVVALAGPYDFLPLDLDVTIAAFGNATNLPSTQPINLVSSDAPAMLLLTGTSDTTVRPRNSAALAERLRQVGASVTSKNYPGLSHIGILLALSVPFRSRGPVLEDAAVFIADKNK